MDPLTDAMIAADWAEEQGAVTALLRDHIADIFRSRARRGKEWHGNGYGDGDGYGDGNGYGYGHGNGYGDGNGYGYGDGNGYGDGDGYG